MAEISFPYEKDTNIGTDANNGGGRQAVTEADWQSMATMWSADRINYTPTKNAMTESAMPFYTRVGTDGALTIQPGEAVVGGFYYKLDAALTVQVDKNLNTTNDRKDILVIQTDLSKGYTKIAISQGAANSAPQAPQPSRQRAGRWELPLYVITVPKNQGAPTLQRVVPFASPADVTSIASGRDLGPFQPEGTFMRCVSPKDQYEAYNGADGYVVTRDLGLTRTYTPKLLYTRQDNPPGLQCKGRYRRIAPNMVWFSVDISNPTNTDYWNDADDNCLAFTLPDGIPLNGETGQTFSGLMVNGGYSAELPNFVDLKGYTWKGFSGNYVRILYQNPKYLAEGYDYARVFPRSSYIIFSGVYETQDLK
ncbi:hypothetical protein ACN20G_23420 [Streptomyces sp. BI20]|uniref:hypothetical protein n=1 Tax=Streptomyces sp. BI20 TaxID=3403460 RepID=UPI003C719EC5